MKRVKINVHLDPHSLPPTRWVITTVRNEYIGLLAYIENENKYLFLSENWLLNFDAIEGETIKTSLWYENYTFDEVVEKINLRVERFVDSFFEETI